MASQRMTVGAGRVPGLRWVLVAVALVLGALATPVVPAEATENQFTFFDGTLTHRSSEYAEATQLPEVPADWTAPVNYTNGRLYVRLDVTRPTSKAVNVQLCIWRNRFTEETCARQAPLVEDGVQWVDFGRPASWWKKGGSWSWGSRFDPVRLMLKDAATGELLLSSRCGAACYTGSDLEEHLPIVLEASAIVVAAGATLAPPASWAGCPPEWSPGCVSGDANAAPVVNAGADLSATTGVPLAITGTATDDGRPEGSVLTTGWGMASGPGTVTFSADTPTTTAVFSAPGVYIIRLTGSDGALSATDTARVTVTDPLPPIVGTAALVSRAAVPPASDRLVQARLRGLGYDVTVVDDNRARTTDFTAFDLVVIAPTVGTSLIPTTFASLEVPVLSLKPQIHRRLSLGTGGVLLSGQTTLDIVADHPLAAGLTGPTIALTRSTSIGRAVPVAAAVVVARPLNRPDDATIFAVETGADLVAGVAPARRAGYYLSASAPTRLTEAGWQLFDAAVGWLEAVEPPPPPAPWHLETLSQRLPLMINPQGVARTGGVVATEITGDSDGVFDPATLRAIEVDATGAVLDSTIAIQFDPAPGFDGEAVRSGTLLIELEGATQGNRRYYLYYGDSGEEQAPPVDARVVLTEGVVDEGNQSLLVETPAGDWWYHTLGGGFSSLVDADDQDWIQWNRTPGSAGTFRGIPNAVFPAGYLHPAFTNSTTEVMAAGPLRVSFETVTDTGAYRARWDITATDARMTMLRADANYWFLYEGLPGGEIDGGDRVVRANGLVTNLTTEWAADLPGEWVAFADTNDGRSLFLSQVVDDRVIDSHRVMQGNMTVFGFGRSGLNSLLSGERQFVLGLVDETSGAGIEPLVEAARTPFTVVVNPTEVRPVE